MFEQGDERARSPQHGIALTSVWPELVDAIPAGDREIAERVLVVPTLPARRADLAELFADAGPTAFDFLVVSGFVLKETTYARRSALEMLGPGDVLAPPLAPSRQIEARAVSRYIAHGSASVAVLDERFRQAARRWPGLSDLLHDRLAQQTHRASMYLAMLHQTRVEERILALFSYLGERFGRMTADGIVLELDVTHDIIGRLAAARRPTVSLALTKLAAQGLLVRTSAGWTLARGALSM